MPMLLPLCMPGPQPIIDKPGIDRSSFQNFFAYYIRRHECHEKLLDMIQKMTALMSLTLICSLMITECCTSSQCSMTNA